MTDVQSLWRGSIPVVAPRIDAMAVIEDVARRHGLKVDDLLGGRRFPPIAHARQEAMWQLRSFIGVTGVHRFSLTRIGQLLGGRDHTTVLFGVRAHERRASQ